MTFNEGGHQQHHDQRHHQGESGADVHVVNPRPVVGLGDQPFVQTNRTILTHAGVECFG